MVVLIGESGSGKSSVMKELVNNHGYKRILEYTTRPKRPNEVDGIDYHFISDNEFSALCDKYFFAAVTYYNTWFYGISLDDCKDENFSEKRIITTNPSALRQLEKSIRMNTDTIITSFYLNVPRRDRLIMTLQRGDKIEEAYRRNLSEVGQFQGIEKEVDYVITNPQYRFSIEELANKIHNLNFRGLYE